MFRGAKTISLNNFEQKLSKENMIMSSINNAEI